MTYKQALCSSDTALRFLTDQLGEDEEHAFEQHLDSCDACRRALKQLAAGDDWWHAARTYLGPEPPLAAVDESGAKDAPTGRDRSWSLDFLGPTDDPRMLGRFGGYEIAGVIGRGGMGIVLKGYDVALNRYVAMKVLAPHLAESASARRRFAREAQAAAAVVHENVIAIHAVDEERGLPYLVMPYFRGASLQKRLDIEGPLATCEVLRIGLQTAAGLAAAHAQGLVHRDIKPGNILLCDTVERVKITDFGLARAADDASLTHSGVIAGTPQYMSPEQARGESVDARSDLFSVGSVLYAMCTGRPPFRAETSYGVLRRISDSDPRPIRELAPETPLWLCDVIGKLHAKRVDERFQSAAEVADVLEQCLAHFQNPTAPLPAWLAQRRAPPLVSRRSAMLCGSVVAVVLIAGVASIAFMLPDDRPHSEGGDLASAPAAVLHDAMPSGVSDELAWEDGSEEALEMSRAETERLDARSRQLFED